MATCSAEDTCAVCLGSLHDPRVLPCLHSLGKTCIDQLSVTATDGKITCPICRASVRLPSGGAAALSKDVTVSVTNRSCDGSLDCGLCDDEKARKKPTGWCKECRIALCESHAMPHIMSASSKSQVHSVVPLSLATIETYKASHGDGGLPKCSHHDQPLRFHCGPCDVSICGDCSAIGKHQGHKPIRYIKDMVEDKKKEVAGKMEKLEKDVVTKLERSLAAVDNVSTELGRRADEVRSEIRETGERAKEMVEAHVQQMIQEVDDMEDYRHKVLDKQRDELKTHLDSARNALRFSKRVMELSGEDEAVFPLVDALDTRATSLMSTPILERPVHHSRLAFKAASDADVACKTKKVLGHVDDRHASAKHSVFEGEEARTVAQGDKMSVTVLAKDNVGRNRRDGGDVVLARCTMAAACSEGSTPSITSFDNGDGSYILGCVFSTAGEYTLEFYVNDQKMEGSLQITCTPAPYWYFDPEECHSSINISEDRRKAFLPAGGGVCCVSVLGSTPMRHGQYTWKMKIGDRASHHILGVATKPKGSHLNTHGSIANGWWSSGGTGVSMQRGVQLSRKLPSWQSNDRLEFHLDCDRHTLRITNLRSGDTSNLSNLPDMEYFPYANFLYAGNEAEFV